MGGHIIGTVCFFFIQGCPNFVFTPFLCLETYLENFGVGA